MYHDVSMDSQKLFNNRPSPTFYVNSELFAFKLTRSGQHWTTTRWTRFSLYDTGWPARDPKMFKPTAEMTCLQFALQVWCQTDQK